MQRLKNRIAIVTGAGSSGLGWGNSKATAVLFAREGAKVAAIDSNPEAAEQTCKSIAAEGGTCMPLVADVTDPASVEAAVQRILDQWDCIDILHNNVGIHRRETMETLSVEDWDLIIDTNLKSVFLTCRSVLPHMAKHGRGAIVNISSINGIRYARRSFAAYSASKGGILALTRVIAVEYGGRGVRANCILPGHIDTPMVRALLPKDDAAAAEAFVKERSGWCPLNKMGDSWDVAYAALYLASDEAKFVTGAELVVDGGVTSATAW